MGVLIEGMEMPTEDEEIIIRIDSNGTVMTEYALPISGTKAVSVPPHGRLIDADLIMKKLKESCRTVFGDDGDIPECSGLSIVSDYIESAPTVIQASGTEVE